MNRTVKKALKAMALLSTDPTEFLRRVRPYVTKARSGIIQVNGIQFNIDLELDPVMRHMYFGTYQSDITGLMARFLKEGDTFIDVGANVGYISAFGLGLVGRSGGVHSFEPVPQFSEMLKNIKLQNPDYPIHVNDVALGENDGVAKIYVTSLKNIGWNTMVPEFMDGDTIKRQLDVTVTALDDYIIVNNIRDVRLIKIDTEGYEFPVLKGLQRYLRSSKELPIMIIEVAPAAYLKLGMSLTDLEDYMDALGYVAQSVDLKTRLKVADLVETTDVVFLPGAQQGDVPDAMSGATSFKNMEV
jgi:FkbM family methyltransferase